MTQSLAVMLAKVCYFVVGLIICCLAIYFGYSFNKQPALLLVFNGQHAKEAENLLASIKKKASALLPYITVCVSDDSSKDFALRHKLRFFEMSNITETGTYLSHNFNKMTKRKFEAIVHLLESQQDVLYIDTDVVLLTNPLKELNYNFELNIQNDQCTNPYDRSYLCTGFMYIKTNPKTINFFKQAIAEIVKSNYTMCDQCALNLLIKNKADISINVLDECKFPNGCRYFEGADKNCNKDQALIVHNNYMIGVDNKLKRFADNGLSFYEAS